jgi:hypothetical protein
MEDQKTANETVIVLKPVKNSDGFVKEWVEYEVDKETAMEQLNRKPEDRNAHWKFAKLKGDVQTELTPEEKIKFDAYMKEKQIAITKETSPEVVENKKPGRKPKTE